MAFMLRGINKSFAGLQVLKDLTMQEEENRIICILGPSGAGKTTLLNIISGVLKADEGEISGFKGRQISYLFQEPRLLPWKTVRENIDFVLKDKLARPEREQVINRYLDMVELREFASYYPDKLSGGMKQRVSIARAFAYPSDILLMDEPFKGLDPQLKMTLIKSFVRLWTQDRRSVFFVTHDIQEAVLIGHVVYVLTDRPAQVKGKVINPVPHKQRNDLDDPALQQIDQEIFKLITLS
jgi:NitT/TauT family transport system ATP-binding protein